jgi:hypothetical protein
MFLLYIQTAISTISHFHRDLALLVNRVLSSRGFFKDDKAKVGHSCTCFLLIWPQNLNVSHFPVSLKDSLDFICGDRVREISNKELMSVRVGVNRTTIPINTSCIVVYST